FQGEEGGGADGQAAVGLFQCSGGAEGGGRVDVGGQAGQPAGLVRGAPRCRPGAPRPPARVGPTVRAMCGPRPTARVRPTARDRPGGEEGHVAVGAEEVGGGVAEGGEAGAAELAAVAGLQALAEGAGAAAGAEGLFEVGQLAFLAGPGRGGDLVGDVDHGGGGGQGVGGPAGGQALGQVEDAGAAGAGGLVGEEGSGSGQAAVAGRGRPGGLVAVELEVVAEGGGQLGQGEAHERQGAGAGGHGVDQGLGAAGG